MNVTLTIDPHGTYPVTLPAEDFDTVADAIGLIGLARKVATARLHAIRDFDAPNDYTFQIGEDGYRMELVNEDPRALKLTAARDRAVAELGEDADPFVTFGRMAELYRAAQA